MIPNLEDNEVQWRIRDSEGRGGMFYPEYRYRPRGSLGDFPDDWKYPPGMPVFWSLTDARNFISRTMKPTPPDVYHPYP